MALDRSVRSQVTGVALIVATVLPGFLTAALAPRIRGDFDFGDSTLGVTVALFYVVSALSSTPCGRLVDRIGGVRGMRLAAALVVACALTVALFAQSAAGLVGLLVLGGVANGMGGPAVSALLKREVSERRQGLAFGVQQSGASIGSLLAGLALPLVAIPFGWRWGFVAAAVLAVAALLFTPGRTQSISNSRLAAVSAVLPDGSYGGETSTRSQPTRFMPQQPRIISRACIVVRPPISGVPVPGAKAGSRLSISKLR